jgi:tRNA-dihydrouridine synthase B
MNSFYPLINRVFMSYWQEKIKIGNLIVPRFMGGPLDGITDSPFRKLVRHYSKDELLYGEMRHVSCVANDKGAKRALDFEQMERPFNYQVSANKIEFIEQACEKIMAAKVDCLDLNIGCPAKNVIKSGCGSALMADLPRLASLLAEFRKHLSIPFTVKIRAGFKEKMLLMLHVLFKIVELMQLQFIRDYKLKNLMEFLITNLLVK